MIRYPYDSAAVEAAIEALDPNWHTKAATRTHSFIAKGRYEETSAIWSIVKPVFIRLQHEKCVFCERRLEGAPYGPVEWDLEHFRPKSNVAVWPDPERHGHINYGAALGGGWDTGYYWLTYELRNYAASCKVCNTRFKLNYFPVASDRANVGASVDALSGERPLLCYPLGDIDEDPEHLVTFDLTTAIPTHNTGERALRGQVIIDFFGLNARDNIHRDRAQMIAILGAFLDERDRGEARPKILAAIDHLRGPHVPHAACVRAFQRLWEIDPVRARRGYDACRFYGFDPAAAPPTI